MLDAANRKMDELKAVISSLREQVASLTVELSKYKSVRNRLNSANLEQENERLRKKFAPMRK